MTTEDDATPALVPWRSAAVKMAIGIALLLADLVALVAFGRAFAPYLPLAMMVGIVVFGVGLHSVLWAGPRAKSRIPPAWRSLVTAAVLLGGLWVLSALTGVAVGVLRRLR